MLTLGITIGVVLLLKWMMSALRDSAVEAAGSDWEGFARRHELHANGAFLHGTYKGYSLVVDTVERKVGRQTVLRAVLHLMVPSMPIGIELKRGGLFDGVVNPVRTTPAFDTLMKHPRIAQSFEKASGSYSDFYIEKGFLHAERGGLPETAAELAAFIAPALELAIALDEVIRSGGAQEQRAAP
ncbi:hypothetical protein [Pyxidicoccus trucidator]|uniref:hypothetical protein n=1 Tax=Pyxidicoccus trucidator TaxID=2709662 RepID=UPI0013D9B382|nr:hypothetical protein [Pyxidicoccus trucidator]